MALTMNSAMATTIADFIGNHFNSGTIEYFDSTPTLLASVSIGASSFSGDALQSDVTGSVTTAGTVASATFKDSGGTDEISVTVTGTGGGGEIEFDQTAWDSGDSVTLQTGFNFTQPTS